MYKIAEFSAIFICLYAKNIVLLHKIKTILYMTKTHRPTQQEINQRKFLSEYYLKSVLPIFSHRFPSVVSCKIEYNREVTLAVLYKDDKPRLETIDIHTHSSRVTIECINPDCTKGIFDLTNVITEMVDRRVERKEGELFCNGYQDAERVGQYHCRCKLFYNIQIMYEN